MAKQRPAHHPPLAGEFNPPTCPHPAYIHGENGVLGFGKPEFYIAAIPRKQAVDIIIKQHYSRRIVNNSYVHLGVFIHGRLLGVLQFGYMLNPRRCSTIVTGTDVTEYLELNRMWLSDDAPRNSESQAISYCIKYIKRACPAVAWIQSFADERCGGRGVVYQAANFIYCGHHMTSFYVLDGETYHEMLLTAHKKSGQRGAYLRANLARADKQTLRQFRYIYFVKRGWQSRLQKKMQPYPKRWAEDGLVASGDSGTGVFGGCCASVS